MDGTFRSRMTLPLARRAASLVLAAAACGVPASAQAADPPFAPEQAAAAVAVATTYWQATPCAGQVDVALVLALRPIHTSVIWPAHGAFCQ